MMGIEEKARERQLKATNIFIASFIAGLNEMGLLNQANVLWASRRAGRSLSECARLRGLMNQAPADVYEKAKFFLEKLVEMLDLAVRKEIKLEGDILSIKIYKNTCKFCPKGVGGAQLEGTLCPYPGMMHEYLKKLLEGQATVEMVTHERAPMVQDDEGCHIAFKIIPA